MASAKSKDEQQSEQKVYELFFSDFTLGSLHFSRRPLDVPELSCTTANLLDCLKVLWAPLAFVAKYAVAAIVGYLKGKSAIHVARTYRDRSRNLLGESFWARGYFVSTVGRDEAKIREYMRKQKQEDIRLDQLKLFK